MRTKPHRSKGLRTLAFQNRRGITLPLVALSLISLCGFAALAIDVGRMAVARVQCQAAADSAAMAAARSLNGQANQDLAAAYNNAANAASAFNVMGSQLTTSNLNVYWGVYRYSYTTQNFTPQYSLQTGELYNLAKANVTIQSPTMFARMFGVNVFNISTTATAAHRPRDVAIVLDYSGSMNNESDLWNCESYLNNGTAAPNNTNGTSNNSETVYPKFGHYSNEKNYSDYTHYANLLCPSADASNPLTNNGAIGKSNVSIAALGVPAMVGDYWKNARGGGAVVGWSPVADASLDANNQASGDKYLRKSSNNAAQPYATNVFDITGSTTANASFETNGYSAYTGSASVGYVQGPRYWGNTFFIWPPDPKNDWRNTFFGTTNNTKLWDASGNWLNPSGNYTINYKAILAWLKADPNPFPATLRSGNILFYSAIPTDIPAANYDHTLLNITIVDPDQRFWKEYIDYVVGAWRDPHGNIQNPQSPTCSYGADYTFGTIQVTAPPGGGQYMNYKDNPERPRHRLWFGPMTMIQYISDTGLLPGTAHDISMYPMKLGVGGALLDIQNNHPNDLVSMVLFDRPQYTNDNIDCGTFNNAQYSLTNNYQSIINSLWLPPNSGTADVRLWDANGLLTPRAHGDFDANTAAQYGFMLAYNQLSSSSTLRALDQTTAPGVGGLGRVGSQRLVIYETDGMANIESTPQNPFFNGGASNSYYQIQPGQSIIGNNYNQTSLLQTVQNICNNPDGSPGNSPGFSPNLGYPGASSPGRPVSIQTIAFGAIFEVPSSTQTSAISLLQQIATIGGTTFPPTSSDPSDGYKWCTGNLTQRQTKLRQAFTNIMNNGIPITLIQ